jgi:hypothetical protein
MISGFRQFWRYIEWMTQKCTVGIDYVMRQNQVGYENHLLFRHSRVETSDHIFYQG